jgi:hypothetical protein
MLHVGKNNAINHPMFDGSYHPCSMVILGLVYYPYAPWRWNVQSNICPNKSTSHVGKYTSTMGHMGNVDGLSNCSIVLKHVKT